MYHVFITKLLDRRANSWQRFRHNHTMYDTDYFYNLLMSLVTNMQM